MSTGQWVLIAAATWLVFTAAWQVCVTPRLRRFHDNDAILGFFTAAVVLWCRLAHRTRIEGLEHARSVPESGPVLYVGNHTNAIDPFIVQVGCRRMVHWLMAKDMMLPAFTDIWKLARVLPVDRTKTDSGPLRAALRLLKAGHCVGIFPEGRITRPPGTIRPFMDGVGMLATRGKPLVVPVFIHGTPDTESVTGSVLGPSHSTVRFLEPMRFEPGTPAVDATKAIHDAMVAASGWPALDDPMPLILGDA